MRQALLQAGLDVALYAEHDSEAAIHFLNDRVRHGSFPSVVLLDWHLGKQCGDIFLRQLRADPRFAAIPVAVFTTSDVSSDMAAGYACGANSYVVKPGTFDGLVRCVGVMCRFWISCNMTPYPAETQC